jgi:photosystem II stability/assembly factor-like uncharacterized protein
MRSSRRPLPLTLSSLSLRAALSSLVLGFGALAPGAAAQAPAVDTSQLTLRRLGPAVMGGRVVDLAVREDRPSTFYVATASGGLWKTTNNGTTFEALFQNERVVSIGALALAPSDPEQLWVGTGEANNRNSTTWGNGIYHSKDGGKTWEHKGLPMSQHVGRIAVHPKDPNVVFVAACGGLWGPNAERGVYRTKDGGKTWDHVLKHDPLTGATEVRIDPKEPNVVYAALYERQRDAFDGNHPAKRWGPGSGLFRSDDGGDTWKKLTKGLPSVQMGRISLDVYGKDPRVVFALLETEKVGQRVQGSDPYDPGTAEAGVEIEEAPGGALVKSVAEASAAAKAGLKEGDIVLAIGGRSTATADEFTGVMGEQRAEEKAQFEVLRGSKLERVDLTFGERTGGRGGRGGRGGMAGFADRIGGQRENVMRQQGPNGFETGGVFVTRDRGESWERVNSLNPRPYYFSQIRVDPSDDNHLYVCGISFYHSSDGGKTFRTVNMPGVHVDHHALWVNPRDGRHLLLGCDGGVNVSHDRCQTWEVFENMDIGQAYHAVADTRRPYWVYAGYQDNGSWGSPSQSQFSEGVMNVDCFKVGGGDGFVCRVDSQDPNIVFSESQGGAIGWRNVITGESGRVSPRGAQTQQAIEALGGRRPQSTTRPNYSFNWNTPFLLSRFNPQTVYFAGNYVFKSVDRGRNVEPISPKITSLSGEHLSAQPSASALSESPRKPGVLYVGTDDGHLWVTQNDGQAWTDRSKAVHDLLPAGKPLWIGHVHASKYKDGRAYLVVDGHRSDDRRPYVFVTEDFGATWKSLAAGLPEDSVRCVYEDTKQEDLLYLGTEMGMYVSFDRGANWQRVGKPFPTVAVMDFDIQGADRQAARVRPPPVPAERCVPPGAPQPRQVGAPPLRAAERAGARQLLLLAGQGGQGRRRGGGARRARQRGVEGQGRRQGRPAPRRLGADARRWWRSR